jgi:DNA (cytosine-5)-methyltransferase 1
MSDFICNKCLKKYTRKTYYDKHILQCKTIQNPVVAIEVAPPLENTVVSTTTNDKKFVDLFSGTGAFSYVFEKNGFECVFANDMVESSKKIYELNNKSGVFKMEDLHNIKTSLIPPHNVLCGGFPCFVSGTKVLTNAGYKEIECVNLSDKLLTHTGDFQAIVNLQKKIYNGILYKIKINNNPNNIITCTDEHPFYIREKLGENVFGSPVWKNANELTMNDYFGMVINANNILPDSIITHKLITKKNWFIMGELLHNIETNNSICVEEHINDFTTVKGECVVWGEIMQEFIMVDGEINKYKIPEWLHNAPKEHIMEFICGYIKTGVYTYSYNIALGLQCLYLKLGKMCSIDETDDDHNDKKRYIVKGEMNGVFIENNYAWFAPIEIYTEQCKNVAVYNFEVDTDNSYIVENIIVHNCQPFSIAGNKKGFDDIRSNVFWKIVEILKYHKPNIIILENVKNLTSHDNGNTYKTIIDNLQSIGYFIKSQVLDTCKITTIPQHRERIYIIGFLDKTQYDKFTFDFPIVQNVKIAELLESDIPEKYYYTDKLKVFNEVKKEVMKHINTNTIYQYRRYYIRENKNNCCPTLTANMGSGGHNVPLLKDNYGIRKLTPKECFNIQGFPKNYKLPVLSDSALYKLAGNAVSIPVIELIIKKINTL